MFPPFQSGRLGLPPLPPPQDYGLTSTAGLLSQFGQPPLQVPPPHLPVNPTMPLYGPLNGWTPPELPGDLLAGLQYASQPPAHGPPQRNLLANVFNPQTDSMTEMQRMGIEPGRLSPLSPLNQPMATGRAANALGDASGYGAPPQQQGRTYDVNRPWQPHVGGSFGRPAPPPMEPVQRQFPYSSPQMDQMIDSWRMEQSAQHGMSSPAFMDHARAETDKVKQLAIDNERGRKQQYADNLVWRQANAMLSGPEPERAFMRFPELGGDDREQLLDAVLGQRFPMYGAAAGDRARAETEMARINAEREAQRAGNRAAIMGTVTESPEYKALPTQEAKDEYLRQRLDAFDSMLNGPGYSPTADGRFPQGRAPNPLANLDRMDFTVLSNLNQLKQGDGETPLTVDKFMAQARAAELLRHLQTERLRHEAMDAVFGNKWQDDISAPVLPYLPGASQLEIAELLNITLPKAYATRGAPAMKMPADLSKPIPATHLKF